jgi:hypothetical protein
MFKFTHFDTGENSSENQWLLKAGEGQLRMKEVTVQ